ncbi:Ribonucleotide reductase regulator NrdR-like protein [Rhodopirellula sallentina SM41]|uniref:Transcriptional repressor NrdR n=1 Tax=Rhodopirellula sallentina SM41 TaxID=1263870 RepID=M5UQP6_9BACT|nr:Ribonucleotide reductase regulator NrdR-like protein [Rhodopirellula sallentina SM41]
MRCPFCHSDNDKVLDSRSAQAGYRVRRKRVCQECGRRFVTMEHIEALNVRVVKSDETREPFDREKIRRGIERACSKRSVASDTIEATVQSIEAAIYAEFDFEIPAEKIGEVVLRFLANVDEVAYIRFASVYREFSDAKDFLRIISVLDKSREEFKDAVPTQKGPVAMNETAAKRKSRATLEQANAGDSKIKKSYQRDKPTKLKKPRAAGERS